MRKSINTLDDGAMIVAPFLKWAGGKRWLVDKFDSILDIKFDRYIEPFLGGGAIYFKLAPKSAILADANPQLIETYQAIKDDWESVQLLLKKHHELHSKDYYYIVREQSPSNISERAARFIYLNRTCWNGLYRVNLNGKFNVPIGTKKNVVMDSDNFEETSKLLSNAILLSADYKTSLAYAAKGDFVFVDPPYTVKHNHNGFVKYNESLFTWEDQVSLKLAINAAVKRGAKVIVTNANHESIKELYKGVGEQIVLNRASVIAGHSGKRGRYEELLIKCL